MIVNVSGMPNNVRFYLKYCGIYGKNNNIHNGEEIPGECVQMLALWIILLYF